MLLHTEHRNRHPNCVLTRHSQPTVTDSHLGKFSRRGSGRNVSRFRTGLRTRLTGSCAAPEARKEGPRPCGLGCGWRPERSETANLRCVYIVHTSAFGSSRMWVGSGRTSHVPGGVQCSSIPGFAVFDMTARACSTTTPARLYFSGVSSDSGIEGDERPGVSGRRRGRRSPSSEISGVGRPVLFDSFRCRPGVCLGPRGS